MSGQSISFKEQMAGFPWAQVIVIAFVRFAEPIAFSSLFTYVYFMIKDFDIAKDDAEISKYSGYLASAFAFCQVLTSFRWGRLADRIGRKPVLVIGLTGTTISLLMFGFAKNYYWALLARCFMGLLNGNVGVIRTCLGEIAKEEKNQSLVFATMPLVYQIGAVFGPLIGGNLSGRETRFDFLRPLVTKFPYALPNIFAAIFLTFSMLIALFFLEETHWEYKYRHDYFVDISDEALFRLFGKEKVQRPWRRSEPLETEEGLLADDNSSIVTNIDDEDLISEVGTPRTRIHLQDTEPEEKDELTYRDLLEPQIFFGILCVFISAIHQTVYNEFTPVFLSQNIVRDDDGNLASRFPFKIVGGLGYTSKDTGTLLSSTGFTGAIAVVLLLPYVTRNFKTLQIYRTCILGFPVLYFIIPYLVFLGDNIPLSKVAAYLISASRALLLAMSIPQIQVTINNSAPKKHRAFVNGATVSTASAARCGGPLIWGYIFAWGQRLEIAWLGWWTLVLMSMMTIVMSRKIRDASVIV
uniref:MFS transporter n=1 Tax=Cyberlindnera americana TaxID=36016 RepID=A0A5P8N8I7_9ASCO|nr:MFS transporter [Cyberlindnera americana]